MTSEPAVNEEPTANTPPGSALASAPPLERKPWSSVLNPSDLMNGFQPPAQQAVVLHGLVDRSRRALVTKIMPIRQRRAQGDAERQFADCEISKRSRNNNRDRLDQAECSSFSLPSPGARGSGSEIPRKLPDLCGTRPTCLTL